MALMFLPENAAVEEEKDPAVGQISFFSSSPRSHTRRKQRSAWPCRGPFSSGRSSLGMSLAAWWASAWRLATARVREPVGSTGCGRVRRAMCLSAGAVSAMNELNLFIQFYSFVHSYHYYLHYYYSYYLFITKVRTNEDIYYLRTTLSILLLHIPDSSIYLFNFIRSFIHTFVLLLASILFVLFITKQGTNERRYLLPYLSYYFIFQILYHVKNEYNERIWGLWVHPLFSQCHGNKENNPPT